MCEQFMARVISLEVSNCMKKSLRTQLTLTIALLSLFTVAFISLLANVFINQKFKSYITDQQKQTTEEIANSLSAQYNTFSRTWNKNSIHIIGMNALYDGYIITVYDNKNSVVWDAQQHDMTLCTMVMSDISQRMQQKYPRIHGEFVSQDIDLSSDNLVVGKVTIQYFGPYFLNENDFQFLRALNSILLCTGIVSLICSIVIAWLLSRRISNPITKIISIAGEISKGNYETRFQGEVNTKELSDLIHSINHLATSLHEQEGLRKQLTADVAHELRTPLTSIGTFLEAMIEGVWEPTGDRLQSCYEEIQRITKLVRDLEQLAKVESDNLKLQKEPFDILQVIQTVSSYFELEQKNKNLEIQIDGHSCTVVADKDRISQVLLNLLSNAMKYSKDDGHVKIHVWETDTMVQVRIQDDGIGIPKEELAFVFERFYRADKSRNRKTGGAGIGLAIVKSIVTAHGGNVWVESELGKGSCFYVSLPKIDV